MSDNQIAVDGDSEFLGMASRLNPLALKPGLVQRSENMRLLQQGAQTRSGAKRMATGIAVANVPLVLSFALAVDVGISTITYAGTTATATTATPHGYATGNLVNIRGATQSQYNGDFTITVTGASSFTYTMASAPSSNATGTMYANKGPVIQNTYAGGVLAAGVFSDPNVNNAREYMVLVGPSAAYLFRQGETLLTKTFPSTEIAEPTDTITVIQAYSRCYILREATQTGLFAPQSVTTLTSSAGVATVTKTAHSFSTGDRIRISGADQNAYNIEADITVTGANTFTYPVSHSPVTPATGTITMRKVKPPLYWDGGPGNFAKATGGSHPAGATFSRMPSAGVATYFNNQLVLPVGRDALLVSDVLDADTYDPVLKSFRVNAGSNDYIVALHPYAEGQLLVFCRKSIYLAQIVIAADGVSIDPAQSSVQLLTNEIGCVARNTICTAGTYVYFLSDRGVYRLDSQFDLKLRGNTRPLSEPIQDLLDTINTAAMHKSHAVYFNNRYMLAVPTLMANGQPSPANNTVFVYSMLNDAWESMDSYSIGVDALLISDYNSRRRVFAASQAGSLFLLEELEWDEQANGLAKDEIQGRLLSRRYQFDTLSQKRFLKATMNLVQPASGSIALKANLIDPDCQLTLGTLTNSTGSEEDYVFKAPIRANSHALELEIATTARQPVIRQISVQASVRGLPAATTRTER